MKIKLKSPGKETGAKNENFLTLLQAYWIYSLGLNSENEYKKREHKIFVTKHKEFN